MSGELSLIIGEKIRKRRIDLGYTQVFLSKRLSTTQNAVSNIEKGKAGLPIEKLIKISEILKVDLNYFVTLNNIDQKEIRIRVLEELTKHLEKRNEILENYIVKLMEEKNAK
jgi:transcriptional regulator with XRE-family HTH domain